ncbi:ribosome-inactivating family protein [Streptomyces sp. NPDC004237]|uniref:ribosome-inactivating family protein n=1 Tax=Streptomyces sp. NPDC004237 TaxID=3154455 RepID=UPI0033AE55B2
MAHTAAPRRPFRRATLTGACAALAAGAVLVTGLTGGTAPSARATHAVRLDKNSVETVANQTPVFWWNGSRWDYFGFLNSIRSQINAHDNSVAGSSNTVSHTDPWNPAAIDVVVGDRHGHQVRLRLRRSDLYLVGWFDQNDTYNYLGPANQAEIPPSHDWPAQANTRGGSRQLLASASYDQIERLANHGNDGEPVTRSTMPFNQDSVSSAASALWWADQQHRELMGQGVLLFTQFISEALRFRGISDEIGWQGFGDRSQDNWQFRTRINPVLVNQETQWGTLSERFNELQRRNRRDDDSAQLLDGWWRAPDGAINGQLLRNLAQFALTLNTVKGFPGRPK